MRPLAVLTTIALLSFAPVAWAGPVAVAPVAIGPALQNDLDHNFGDREGDYLRRETADRVTEALARVGANVVGAAPVTIEVTIIDADPNRPTFDQLGHTPGLDMRSVSIGGAELHGVVRAKDGRVLTEVSTRLYDPFLDPAISGYGTWTSARRAIDRFSRQLAEAYRSTVASS